MKYKILIGCMLCLFSFIPKGAANLVLNPYTSQEISADSIIERVMTFAPSYESIVSEYSEEEFYPPVRSFDVSLAEGGT